MMSEVHYATYTYNKCGGLFLNADRYGQEPFFGLFEMCT